MGTMKTNWPTLEALDHFMLRVARLKADHTHAHRHAPRYLILGDNELDLFRVLVSDRNELGGLICVPQEQAESCVAVSGSIPARV